MGPGGYLERPPRFLKFAICNGKLLFSSFESFPKFLRFLRTIPLILKSFEAKGLIFAGAARRAGPDSMLILCLCVCVCVSEIISRPLIGRKLATSPDVVQRS